MPERTLGQLRAIELPRDAVGEAAESLRATIDAYAGAGDDIRLDVVAELADLAAAIDVKSIAEPLKSADVAIIGVAGSNTAKRRQPRAKPEPKPTEAKPTESADATPAQ